MDAPTRPSSFQTEEGLPNEEAASARHVTSCLWLALASLGCATADASPVHQ